MKTLWQEHQEEQREAALLQALKRFHETLRTLELDHRLAQNRLNRQHRLFMLAMGCVVAAVLLPIVVILIRRWME